MSRPSEKAKMLAGELYDAADPELVAERERAQQLLERYNGLLPKTGSRTAQLQRLLGSIGAHSVIMPIFSCDYGYNISIGHHCFVNYQCIFLDCAPITIGNYVQLGPAVQLYTATHPLKAELRRSGLESARPIRIGDDVWIGGGAIVLPGVTIGDGSVIGAGAVVVRDIPAGVVVVGNPARVVRRVTSQI